MTRVEPSLDPLTYHRGPSTTSRFGPLLQVDCKTYKGIAALMKAAGNDHRDVAQLLVVRRAEATLTPKGSQRGVGQAARGRGEAGEDW